MAKDLEKKLLEELSRFKQIKHNTENLDEQMVSGIGSGGLGMGSHIDRLAKRVGIEMEEQDIPLDPEAEETDLETDLDTDVEGEEGEVEAELDIDTEETEDVGTDTDTTEVDVTSLVDKQEEVSTELEGQKDILEKNTESLDDLMAKLSDLETHLSSMDDMVSKINNLEDKLEKYRPRTQQEKIELRKHDSGPYHKTLTDFFTDKEEIFDKTGKKQYILTQDEVDNYSESDIQKSFNQKEEGQ
jgi:chromosome segregation ATPase|tara:strand:- start:156 stop:884 length:729 start_codon:yes stop_codon:yes gene_type:complete